ncbi:hypothetical protein NDU88_009220 [Pleurodeles waltl]|uniref:Uncharacterized protein n=1 Tax=Pleurodeles waltl TaxID=8319 RepID=A0AAV7RUN0_PLEWA|nr:hypothetical protein NDU88_009220 [Pleurodeles waltl]
MGRHGEARLKGHQSRKSDLRDSEKVNESRNTSEKSENRLAPRYASLFSLFSEVLRDLFTFSESRKSDFRLWCPFNRASSRLPILTGNADPGRLLAARSTHNQ